MEPRWSHVSQPTPNKNPDRIDHIFWSHMYICVIYSFVVSLNHIHISSIYQQNIPAHLYTIIKSLTARLGIHTRPNERKKTNSNKTCVQCVCDKLNHGELVRSSKRNRQHNSHQARVRTQIICYV